MDGKKCYFCDLTQKRIHLCLFFTDILSARNNDVAEEISYNYLYIMDLRNIAPPSYKFTLKYFAIFS